MDLVRRPINKKASFTFSKMKSAIEAVVRSDNPMSIKRASKEFNIRRSTLSR